MISGNCIKCGTWRQSLHRDHIIPKFKGGSNDSENIQLLCANCHQDKSIEERRGYKRNTPAWNKGLVGAQQHSSETRSRMSESHKGKIPWNKGISQSSETRARISAALKGNQNSKGITRSLETRARMSESHKR